MKTQMNDYKTETVTKKIITPCWCQPKIHGIQPELILCEAKKSFIFPPLSQNSCFISCCPGLFDPPPSLHSPSQGTGKSSWRVGTPPPLSGHQTHTLTSIAVLKLIPAPPLCSNVLSFSSFPSRIHQPLLPSSHQHLKLPFKQTKLCAQELFWLAWVTSVLPHPHHPVTAE